MDVIYLDNNATTRPLPVVREAVCEAMREIVGNPSSPHSSGNEAAAAIEQAREEVAALLAAHAENITFVSGGTEANNIVLQSALHWAGSSPAILTIPVEHSSVLKTLEAMGKHGARIVEVSVDSRGIVVLDQIERALRAGMDLVSIQWVNNETGVVQPVGEICALCAQYGVRFHADAAQAVGKLSIDLSEVPVDFLTFSGHKFHGPLGVGGIFARDPASLRSLTYGGSQERGLHPGTENVPAVVGLGAAARTIRLRFEEHVSHLRRLRGIFEEAILRELPWARINGDASFRVANTTNICFARIDGQALVARLDASGIRCSQSSACTSARPEPSYVLRAMGLTEAEAYSSARFSLSAENTLAEIERAAALTIETCLQLSRLAPVGGVSL